MNWSISFALVSRNSLIDLCSIKGTVCALNFRFISPCDEIYMFYFVSEFLSKKSDIVFELLNSESFYNWILYAQMIRLMKLRRLTIVVRACIFAELFAKKFHSAILFYTDDYWIQWQWSKVDKFISDKFSEVCKDEYLVEFWCRSWVPWILF